MEKSRLIFKGNVKGIIRNWIPVSIGMTTLFIGLLSGWAAVAAAQDVAEVQSKMKAAQRALSSVQFHYVQTSQSGSGDLATLQKSSGTLILKKPNQFRIEQKSPEAQIVICDGKKVTIVTPRFQQALVMNYDAWLAKNLGFVSAAFMDASFDDLLQNYRWALTKQSSPANMSPQLEVELTPKSDGVLEPKIRLRLDENFYPAQIQWKYQDTFILTTIAQLEANVGVDNERFRYHPDKNTQVIPIR